MLLLLLLQLTDSEAAKRKLEEQLRADERHADNLQKELVSAQAQTQAMQQQLQERAASDSAALQAALRDRYNLQVCIDDCMNE